MGFMKLEKKERWEWVRPRNWQSGFGTNRLYANANWLYEVAARNVPAATQTGCSSRSAYLNPCF